MPLIRALATINCALFSIDCDIKDEPKLGSAHYNQAGAMTYRPDRRSIFGDVKRSSRLGSSFGGGAKSFLVRPDLESRFEDSFDDHHGHYGRSDGFIGLGWPATEVPAVVDLPIGHTHEMHHNQMPIPNGLYRKKRFYHDTGKEVTVPVRNPFEDSYEQNFNYYPTKVRRLKFGVPTENGQKFIFGSKRRWKRSSFNKWHNSDWFLKRVQHPVKKFYAPEGANFEKRMYIPRLPTPGNNLIWGFRK